MSPVALSDEDNNQKTLVWSRANGNGLEYCEVQTEPMTMLR
jgi:hypothetical protein